jgi:hypothetical protein
MRLNDITEALSSNRKQKGEVAFRRSTVADQHIQKVIQRLEEKSGVPAEFIHDYIDDNINRLKEVQKYSPFLFDTMLQNQAEEATFSLIHRSENLKEKGFSDLKFDIKVMIQLVKKIELEHKGWFSRGLRQPRSFKKIYEIRPIFVPSQRPEYQKFNAVTTAACSDKGEFIFNVPFMQRLLDYGNAIDIKANGAVYQSNGGVIPDAYAYIEFLIMHELMHYVFGDFVAGHRFKQFEPIAHNWAGDFRSNYMLVKSGYTQLPLGLYSDDLNYDRDEIKTYKDLITMVDSEMKKLPPHLRQWARKEFEMDEHEDPKPPKPPQPQVDTRQKSEPLKVGDVVKHRLTGTPLVITDITSDGKAVTRRATSAEVAAAKTPKGTM